MTTTPGENTDLPGYLDLTLFDADEQDLVDRAIDDAQVKMPEWSPREGNTEVVLIEGLALVVAELVYAINRLPDAAVEGVLQRYNLARDPGAPARGRVEFVLADNLGHLIPAGTTVRVETSVGVEVDFTTVEPLEILFGATSGQVDVVAVENGTGPNGVAAGTPTEVVDAVPYVETCEVVTAIAGGRDVETDQAFRDRGSALLSRQVTTVVLPGHFTAAAIENPAVGRATTLSAYSPTSGNQPGADLGHVTVAVADQAGAPLPAEQRAAIEQTLEARASAGLDVHVISPTYTPFDVTCTVTTRPGFFAADVQATVDEALRGYLSPATWAWGSTVYRNELIALIDRVPGVDRVVDVAVPAGDTALLGVAPLVQPGAILVAVQ